MPIYIAATGDGYIEDVIMAKNRELANAYWQGKGVFAHSIREIKEENLANSPTGIIPIVYTVVKSIYVNGQFRDFRLIGK